MGDKEYNPVNPFQTEGLALRSKVVFTYPRNSTAETVALHKGELTMDDKGELTMGDKVIVWLSAKMPGLIGWAGGLSEGQLIAAAVMGMLLLYAVITAVYNAGLLLGAALSVSHGADSSPRGGALRRIISAPTRWDETEPYEEWMAEVWRDRDG